MNEKKSQFDLFMKAFTSTGVISAVSSVAAFYAVTKNDVNSFMDLVKGFLLDWVIYFALGYVCVFVGGFFVALVLESPLNTERSAKVFSVIIPVIVALVFGCYWWNR